MKQKTFFIVFKELSFGEKIKIWQKIADTSFKFFKNVAMVPRKPAKFENLG